MRFFGLIFIVSACASAPQQAIDGPTRFNERYGKSMVDSKEAPEWMSRGAGCALGQMTAIQAGQASVVPAHLCVGIQSGRQTTNATCEAAEQKAWTGLAQLFGVVGQVKHSGNSVQFGGKSITIQGARVETTWRGNFNGSPVCALQIAWPVSEYESLQASWGERGDEAQRLYQRAIAEGAEAKQRCEDLKRSGELIASIPGNRKLAGQVQNSNLLNDLIIQALGAHCKSDKKVIIGVACQFDGASKKCPNRLTTSIVKIMTSQGFKVLGTPLKGPELERMVAGGESALQRETTRQSARYFAVGQIFVEPQGMRGSIPLCKANFDFRLLDADSGAATVVYQHNGRRTGGKDADQCFFNATKFLFRDKKMVPGLLETFKKNP